MSEVIPTFTEFANFREEITLDEVTYILDFVYNVQSEKWVLNILLADETPVLYGATLVLDYDILSAYRSLPNVPPGLLFCVDNTGEEETVTRTNLGDTVELVYVPEAET